jgi:hypothetical protein
MLQPDKKTAIVHGHRMAYREIGEGDPIIFAHSSAKSDGPPLVSPYREPLGDQFINGDLHWAGLTGRHCLDGSTPSAARRRRRWPCSVSHLRYQLGWPPRLT